LHISQIAFTNASHAFCVSYSVENKKQLFCCSLLKYKKLFFLLFLEAQPCGVCIASTLVLISLLGIVSAGLPLLICFTSPFFSIFGVRSIPVHHMKSLTYLTRANK
jgi:hypothetical protein